MTTTFVEATTQEELEKVFAFRYKIVCEKLGVDSLDYCEPGRETDEYDAYAMHFAAFDEQGEVAACVRLIHNSPIGYPTANHMRCDIDQSAFEPHKVAELSRIFVNAEKRGIQETKRLFQGLKEIVYLKGKALGIEYTYGGLEKPFLKLLNMFKYPYKPIGEEQDYVGRRYPCIMYTRELEAENPELLRRAD
ncbi:GNAT family N-acyltransferase [Sulfurimonas sp. HSL-1656]|uniref:acyl-homoserine-lactone synthase n=1 Tax=Thiomicrolovo subterrani TaxID=3131934 RepID=UPI0031F96FFA